MSHRLKIHSLRDLNATCTCGQWELSATTTNSETNAKIITRAREQFRRHIHQLCLKCRRPPRGPIRTEYFATDVGRKADL